MRLFSRLLTVLSLFLALAVLMFVLQNDTRVFPSATNTKSSGFAAFAELLKKRGYKVRVDGRIRPILRKGDLLVVPRLGSQDYSQDRTPEAVTRFAANIKQATSAGQTCLFLRVPEHPRTDGSDLVKLAGTEGKYRLAVSPQSLQMPIGVMYAPLAEIQPKPEGPHVALLVSGVGNGSRFTLPDASILTNRSITKFDHARFGLDVLSRLVQPGGTVVFAEYGIGNQTNESALDYLGSWAHSIAWQALLVVLAVFYTLGRPFGSLAVTSPPARTARDLIAAMSATLQRANHLDQALLILLNSTYDRVRKAVQAPTGAPLELLHRQISPELTIAISAVRTSFQRRLTSGEALKMAVELENATAAFESQMKATRVIGQNKP